MEKMMRPKWEQKGAVWALGAFYVLRSLFVFKNALTLMQFSGSTTENKVQAIVTILLSVLLHALLAAAVVRTAKRVRPEAGWFLAIAAADPMLLTLNNEMLVGILFLIGVLFSFRCRQESAKNVLLAAFTCITAILQPAALLFYAVTLFCICSFRSETKAFTRSAFCAFAGGAVGFALYRLLHTVLYVRSALLPKWMDAYISYCTLQIYTKSFILPAVFFGIVGLLAVLFYVQRFRSTAQNSPKKKSGHAIDPLTVRQAVLTAALLVLSFFSVKGYHNAGAPLLILCVTILLTLDAKDGVAAEWVRKTDTFLQKNMFVYVLAVILLTLLYIRQLPQSTFFKYTTDYFLM